MDSGSSKGGRAYSGSRPRGPSGDACRELLFVMSCVVWGDMIGDGCRELEATDEALIADGGMYVEVIELEKFVWT